MCIFLPLILSCFNNEFTIFKTFNIMISLFSYLNNNNIEILRILSYKVSKNKCLKYIVKYNKITINCSSYILFFVLYISKIKASI